MKSRQQADVAGFVWVSASWSQLYGSRYFFFTDCPTYFPLFSIAHEYGKDALLKTMWGACNLQIRALVYTLWCFLKNKASEEQGVIVNHVTESYLSLATLKLVISFIKLWLQTSACGNSIWNASLISYTVLFQMLISPICNRLDFLKTGLHNSSWFIGLSDSYLSFLDFYVFSEAWKWNWDKTFKFILMPEVTSFVWFSSETRNPWS